jgi:radical SAM-linked protein
VTEPAATAGPVGPAPEALGHLRLRFAKVGKVRWTSHRDVARMWERALRRAGLPVAYSGGFSPHPLLSFGLALPTGCESTAEYVDVALDPAHRLGAERAEWMAAMAADAVDVLVPLLPEGVAVLAAATVEPGSPSLQQVVTSCSWRIAVAADLPAAEAAVARAMAAPALPVVRERKGRRQTEDLRPSLHAATVAPDGDDVVLLADTGTRPRGVRPAELADALGLPLGLARRTHQWIDRDGSRTEPMVAREAPVPVTVGCPS